jgi:hypothetical protein
VLGERRCEVDDGVVLGFDELGHAVVEELVCTCQLMNT